MRTLKSLRRRSRLWLLALAAASVVLLAALADGAGTAAAHTYYLSPSGNDHSVGTSLAHAWRTLARASRLRPRPGDRILLQGGASFAGTLRVIVAGRGNPRAPVVIGSYGPGDATIEAGGKSSENAVWGYRTPYDEMTKLGGYYAFYTSRVDSIETA